MADLNWDALGAIAESVGALAVILTLIYLSIQVKQHTNAVRASALDAIVARIMDVRGKILESGELTEGSMAACDDCHTEYGGPFEEGTDNLGVPELNEYGSQAWLKAFLADPGSEQFFGERNQMPSFADKLTPPELDLLVRADKGSFKLTPP